MFFYTEGLEWLTWDSAMRDPLYRASLKIDGLRGVLDEVGAAEIPLRSLLSTAPIDALRRDGVRVCYFTEAPDAEEARRKGHSPIRYGVPETVVW